MLVSKNKISLPTHLKSLMKSDDDGPILMMSGEDVEKNQVRMQSYINSSRAHLENLKSELYKLLDVGYATAELYKVTSQFTAD